MASLSLLPIEIIRNIAKNIDYGDILALRMTSRVLNNKAVEAHLDSLYKCHHVCLSQSSLYDLITISRNHLVNFRVRHLVISNLIPEGLHYRCDNEDAIESIRTEATGVLGGQISEENTLETLWHKYFDVLEPQEGLPEEIWYLALAFTGLPNLRTIDVSHGLPVSEAANRTESNILHQSPAIVPGNHTPEDGQHPKPKRFTTTDLSRKVWGVVMSAIALSKLQGIEKIGCTGLSTKFTLPHLWLSDFHQFSKTYSPLLHLKSVELGINYGEVRAGALVGPAFFSWLTAIGGSLRSLKINIYPWQNRQRRLSRPLASENQHNPVYLKSIHLPKLECLSFQGLELDVDDLEAFLRHSGNSLTSIVLENCQVVESKKDWSQILQYFRYQCPLLVNFTIQPRKRYKNTEGRFSTRVYCVPRLHLRNKILSMGHPRDWNSRLSVVSGVLAEDEDLNSCHWPRTPHIYAPEFWHQIVSNLWEADETFNKQVKVGRPNRRRR